MPVVLAREQPVSGLMSRQYVGVEGGAESGCVDASLAAASSTGAALSLLGICASEPSLPDAS
jgi:hypothetical protein